MTLCRVECDGCAFYCGSDSHREVQRVAQHHYNFNLDLRGEDKRPIHVPRITARATVVVHGRQVHLGELGVPA